MNRMRDRSQRVAKLVRKHGKKLVLALASYLKLADPTQKIFAGGG